MSSISTFVLNIYNQSIALPLILSLPISIVDIYILYTLFDGLAYNTCGYFAIELRSIFPSPAGARKNTSNEQNVRTYYMLNHRIRGLLFHYKKNCFLAIGFYFLVRVFRNILIPSGRMTLTMSKMFARIMPNH